jgi:glutaconate CoA-transferase subunit B
VTAADLMVAVLAREVRDGDVVGVGLGTPLALCAALIARETGTHADVLVAGAVSPEADLVTCMRGAGAVAGRTPGYVPHIETMDMAERQAMTLQFLRPAQVDREGSTNTSSVRPPGEPRLRFPGGLAMADVPRLMPRIVLYHTDHRPRGVVERVDVVTGRGGASERGGYASAGPTLLVSDLCVIAFGPDGPRLTSVHPGVDRGHAVAATGFALEAAPRVPVTEPPRPEEVAAMERIDPHGLRGVEVRETRADALRRMARLIEGDGRSPA